MPQLIGWALAGAALYAGYKWLAKGLRRARAELGRRGGERTGAPKDLGELEWDAKAGVYRPVSKS